MLLVQAADFGPKTALKIVDRIREGIKSGKVKTADDTRTALKVCAAHQSGLCGHGVGWAGGVGEGRGPCTQ